MQLKTHSHSETRRFAWNQKVRPKSRALTREVKLGVVGARLVRRRGIGQVTTKNYDCEDFLKCQLHAASLNGAYLRGLQADLVGTPAKRK
jgi:hypothetical protein